MEKQARGPMSGFSDVQGFSSLLLLQTIDNVFAQKLALSITFKESAITIMLSLFAQYIRTRSNTMSLSCVTWQLCKVSRDVSQPCMTKNAVTTSFWVLYLPFAHLFPLFISNYTA